MKSPNVIQVFIWNLTEWQYVWVDNHMLILFWLSIVYLNCSKVRRKIAQLFFSLHSTNRNAVMLLTPFFYLIRHLFSPDVQFCFNSTKEMKNRTHFILLIWELKSLRREQTRNRSNWLFKNEIFFLNGIESIFCPPAQGLLIYVVIFVDIYIALLVLSPTKRVTQNHNVMTMNQIYMILSLEQVFYQWFNKHLEKKCSRKSNDNAFIL